METVSNIVLSGGGIRGLAFCGALKALQDHYGPDLKIDDLVAVSVGSIVGLMFLAGYTGKEMCDVVVDKEFSDLHDPRISNIIWGFGGLDNGGLLVAWLSMLLKDKGIDPDVTFLDFYSHTGCKFQVVVSVQDSYFKPVYTSIYSHMTSPNVKVIDAVRCSISVPFIFTNHRLDMDGTFHTCVDGALTDNFPIHLFDGPSLERTLGLCIDSGNSDSSGSTQSWQSFFFDILHGWWGPKRKHIAPSHTSRTIFIDPGKVTDFLQFDLDRESKLTLVESGFNLTKQFLDTKHETND